MATEAVENLVKQALALSTEEQRELRAKLEACSDPSPDDKLGAMLRDLGIGRPRKPGVRNPNPTPLQVEGKPLYEQLIEERR